MRESALSRRSLSDTSGGKSPTSPRQTPSPKNVRDFGDIRKGGRIRLPGGVPTGNLSPSAMTESEATFILNLVSGIGPVRARRLRERFGSLDRVLVTRESDLKAVEGIGPELAKKIAAWESTTDPERERKWAAE